MFVLSFTARHLSYIYSLNQGIFKMCMNFHTVLKNISERRDSNVILLSGDFDCVQQPSGCRGTQGMRFLDAFWKS
jgi:hypothetical protein